MLQSLRGRISSTSKDLKLFVVAMSLGGFSGSIVDAVFNNYLSETYRMGDFARTLLEIPREVPGLIVVLVSALLYFLCSRRLAALSMGLAAAGLALIAFASLNLPMMLIWLFVYSMGQHLFIPLNASIGMELAREGEAGKRLGQFSAARNFAAIAGSFVVFLGFRFLNFTFTTAFVIGAVGFLAAGIVMYRMKATQPHPAGVHLRLYKEYGLYYWLSILYGTRKQIFLTFAPWVLVTVFKQPTAMVATLLTIGGVVGIFFQPILGKAIDRLGERFVLTAEAVVLVFVCLGYGFSKAIFGPHLAFIVAAVCFLMDQLLMSVGMARATYMKKIALDPAHVTPTLTMAVSIDHIFSIATAVLCGLVWKQWGYQAVFLIAAGIAVVNIFSALRVRVPLRTRPAN